MFLQNYITQSMLDTKSLIHVLKELGKPQEEFITANIDEFKKSEKYKNMKKAQDYYAAKHDVLDKKRYYIDRKGVKREDEYLSNNKLIHPYFTKLVNQKVNYLLAKEFSLQVDDDNEKAKEFRDGCGKYFNKKFMKKLREIGRQAIINGVAWVQVYYDENGKLSFKRIPSDEIIPFWHDAEHTVLDGLLRFYTIVEYAKNGEKKEITKVEYYTTEGTWLYEVRDGKLKLDESAGVTLERPYKGHFQTKEIDKDGKEVLVDSVWNKIPFICFKYNEQELSLLTFVKSLIDNYDEIVSTIGDTIKDVPNSIKVVRGYGGGDKGQFSQNLATYKTIFVDDPNGGVELLVANQDTTCTTAHLDRLKEDIYEVGSGVNLQKDLLNYTSGVALKIRYSDLDADCMSMASSFASSLEELCWFIKNDMGGEMADIDFEDIELDILFNADGIVNENDVIQNCMNSVGIISDETIIANHPWTTDLDKELKRVEEQKEEQMELEQEMNDGFGTNTPNTTTQTGNN